MSGEDKQKIGDIAKWGGLAVIAIGVCFTIWQTTMAVPVLQSDVKAHEKRLTIVETQYTGIKDDLTEIKGLLRARNRRDDR